MSENTLLYLSQDDVVRTAVTMREIISVLEEAFRQKGDGEVEMPPKPGVHPKPDAFIHAMPAYLPAMQAVGVKWVSGYPQNQQRGLPYITGLLILNDPETGVPICIMDCAWITAMRTGAASALAAKYLARPGSSRLGVLGCGVQGRTNLFALNELFPLEEIHAFDLVPAVSQRYASEMHEQTGLLIKIVADARSAVQGMDIVVTAGPILREPHATIQAGWLAPGSFASPVDFDSYFSAGALQEAAKFCTDDLAQLLYYQKAGYFKAIPGVYADLGEIVSGRKAGRQSPEEIIMCMNLGLGLEDIAVAPIVYRRAIEQGIGTWLRL